MVCLHSTELVINKKPTTTAAPKTKVTTKPKLLTTPAKARTTKKPPTAPPRTPAQAPKAHTPTPRPRTANPKPHIPAPKPTSRHSPGTTNPTVHRRQHTPSVTVRPSLSETTTVRPGYTTTLRVKSGQTHALSQTTRPPATTQTVTPPTTVHPTTKRPSNTHLSSPSITTPRPVYWSLATKPTSKTLQPNFTLPKAVDKPQETTESKSDQPDSHKRGRGKGRKRGKGERRRSRTGQVRLVSTDARSDRGRVEIFIKGEWGTVCDDLFNLKAAAVVCRQLGFARAIRVAKRAELGPGANDLNILLDDVECEGMERTLLHCKRAKIGKHNCSHEEDVGVVCGYQETE